MAWGLGGVFSLISVAGIRRTTGVSAGAVCSAPAPCAQPPQCASACGALLPVHLRLWPSAPEEPPKPALPCHCAAELQPTAPVKFLRLRRTSPVHQGLRPQCPSPCEAGVGNAPVLLVQCCTKACGQVYPRARVCGPVRQSPRPSAPVRQGLRPSAPASKGPVHRGLWPSAQGPPAPVAQCTRAFGPACPVRTGQNHPPGAHPRGASNSGN